MKKLIFGCVAALAAGAVFAEVPRPEYPRPQFERAAWVNLNGPWTYAFDFGQSGMHEGRELYRSKGFDKTIVVPFCPESKLSGVGYLDFIPAMWYHRKLAVPSEWKGKRVYLRFGGVDYESEIFVDGVSAGLHYGGSASFSIDLTQYVTPGRTHDLVVRVKDANNDGQPFGKQSARYKSQCCDYTRTTGIWQTVWLEAVDPAGLESCRIVADLNKGAFVFTPAFVSERARTLRITVKAADGKVAGAAEVRAAAGVAVAVPLSVVKPWSPEDPHLYDIVYETLDAAGRVTDVVKAYAGLRTVSVENGRICLNGRPRYLRFVLDQGFYPDGVWTAPSDAALRKDIELSLAAGFNGARLHQKVFEERYHYWADRLGYLTWGEMSSWGAAPQDVTAARNFIPEWCEVVRRDLNHPSIIAWVPYNETYFFDDARQHQRTQNDVYELTKAIDPTRPVNGASGGFNAKTDLWTIHNYARAPKLGEIDRPEGEVWTAAQFRERRNMQTAPYNRYGGQPYLVDEFGGLVWFTPDRRWADNSWSRAAEIRSEEEFFSLLKDEVDLILGMKRICGFCYTQLTDVEQEQNGVCYYDRTPKFDLTKFKAIFGAARTIRILQLGDPQFGFCKPVDSAESYSACKERFLRMIDLANTLRPDVVIVCGDMCHRATDLERDWPELIRRFEVPVAFAPGNHDLGQSVTAENLERFRKVFGRDRDAFTIGGWRFIVGNSQFWRPTDLTEEQSAYERWVDAQLDEARAYDGHVVLVSHVPPFDQSPDEADSYNNFPLAQRAARLARYRAAGAKLYLAGHTHRQDLRTADGLTVFNAETTCWNFDNCSFGGRLLTLRPDLTSDYSFVPLITNN